MAERILTADEVAGVESWWLTKRGLGQVSVLALCHSHEALRAELAEMREQRLDMLLVARRYRDGWRPIVCVDGPIWCHPDDPNDPDPRLHDALTDAEAAALDALEAGDGD